MTAITAEDIVREQKRGTFAAERIMHNCRPAIQWGYKDQDGKTHGGIVFSWPEAVANAARYGFDTGAEKGG